MAAEGRVAALERMLSSKPDDPRLRFALAVEYLNRDRVEDGIRELEAYLAGSDDQGNAWGRLAGALRSIGRDDEAANAYRKGVEAARRHGHPTMAEEFEEELRSLGS